MKLRIVLVVGLVVWSLLDCSSSCPAVPLHCACGGDPTCVNGQWVCQQCIDGGASDAAAE